MLNGVELYERFKEFGLVTLSPGYPMDNRHSVRLTIYFQPPDTKTDTETRRAMYDLAEKVIEIARTEYELIFAPEFSLTGEMYYKSPQSREPYIVTEGHLELCFTERRNDDLPAMP